MTLRSDATSRAPEVYIESMRDAGFGAGFVDYASGDMRRLQRLAYMLTGDVEDARDLVQETLLRVGLAWRRIDQDRSPGAYANKVMSRLVWRQRRRSKQVGELNPASVDVYMRDEFTKVDDASLIRAAMRQLGPRQRAVLALRYYCDLSEAEIASTLECSPGTVKSQAARGLARLRASLQDLNAPQMRGDGHGR